MRRTVAACRAFSFGLRPPGAAAGPGGLEALAGALDDQLALELIDRAENMENQPPGRRGGVDLLLQDDQADAALAQLLGERQQVLQRPHRARQPGDDEHVALAQVGQRLVELGAVGVLAGGGVGSCPSDIPTPRQTGAPIGYARVSTSGQLFDRPSSAPARGRLHPRLRRQALGVAVIWLWP